jgi:hypothetical protein
VAELLSPGWFQAVERALAGHLPSPRPGAAVVVQVAVTVPKAPEHRWWVRCTLDGATVREGSATEDAGITVTVPLPDVPALLDGSLPLDVGFMQGRVKVDGPTGAVLALLEWSAGAEFAVARQALAETTDPT